MVFFDVISVNKIVNISFVIFKPDTLNQILIGIKNDFKFIIDVINFF